MKNWLSKNIGLLIILLVFAIVAISAQKLMLEKAELKAQLAEQQEIYERTQEDYYDALGIVDYKLEKQQELYAELTEDYQALVIENSILEDKLIQAMEDAEGIYTEEDIRYAIDIFTAYLVDYPPSGFICVYENGTLFVFEMVNDKLVLDEMLSYEELKELWLNK